MATVSKFPRQRSSPATAFSQCFAVPPGSPAAASPPPCTRGVRQLAKAMDEAMYSDDEAMFAALMEEEPDKEN
jgi:hypothetical protein